MKKSGKKTTTDMMMACCTSTPSLAHTVLGIGLGLLATQYLGLVNPALWGWALVVVGVVIHFMKGM